MSTSLWIIGGKRTPTKVRSAHSIACGYGALDDSWVPFTDMNAPCAREAYEYMREITDLSGQVILAQVAARRVALQAERDPMVLPPAQGKGSVSAPSAPIPPVLAKAREHAISAPPRHLCFMMIIDLLLHA